MKLIFLEAFVLVVAMWPLLSESRLAPVLSRLGSSSGALVGDQLTSVQFKDELTVAFSGLSHPELTLIVIKNQPQQLTSDQFLKEMRGFEIETDNLFAQQVNEPYTALVEFLATHPNIRVARENVDSINEGLIKFVDAQNAKKPVILLQESVESTLLRSKRKAEKDDDEQQQQQNLKANVSLNYIFGDKCAAFFETVSMLDETGEPKPTVDLAIDKASLTFSCPNGYGTPQVLTIGFTNGTLAGKGLSQITLTFLMTNNTLYYKLNSTVLTMQDKTQYPLIYMGTPYYMETPVNFSFACTRTPFLLRHTAVDPKDNIKAMFYINTLQLQSGGIVPNGSNYTFGQVNYCQGFFSSGIWMAITSSLLLAFILAFGVTALMTIQTNDRLDDPKGKPLNIGQEK